MAALIKRRTKMVSIRLLDDEYRQLKDLCAAKGARSVSDLARDAMFRMLDDQNREPVPLNLQDRVVRLDQTVAKLGQKMEDIENRLAGAGRLPSWGK